MEEITNGLLHRRCSTAGHRFQPLRIAIAFHGDAGCRFLDLVEVLWGQLDIDGGEILLEPRELRGARDRHDPRLLSQQPGERDLRRGRLLGGGDPVQQIDIARFASIASG